MESVPEMESGEVNGETVSIVSSVEPIMEGTYMLFSTPTKAASDKLRCHMEDIIDPGKLSSALEFVSKVNLSSEDFKNLWKACEVLGVQHRWLLFNVIEIAQGER